MEVWNAIECWFPPCLVLGHDTVTYTMGSGQGVIETEKVTSEKDLGVFVDQALNFSDHISTKVSKANRNLGIIFKTFTYMDKEIHRNCMFTSIQKRYDSNRKCPEESHKISL